MKFTPDCSYAHANCCRAIWETNSYLSDEETPGQDGEKIRNIYVFESCQAADPLKFQSAFVIVWKDKCHLLYSPRSAPSAELDREVVSLWSLLLFFAQEQNDWNRVLLHFSILDNDSGGSGRRRGLGGAWIHMHANIITATHFNHLVE